MVEVGNLISFTGRKVQALRSAVNPKASDSGCAWLQFGLVHCGTEPAHLSGSFNMSHLISSRECRRRASES